LAAAAFLALADATASLNSCCSLLPARLLLLMALNSSTLALGCMDLLRV